MMDAWIRAELRPLPGRGRQRGRCATCAAERQLEQRASRIARIAHRGAPSTTIGASAQGARLAQIDQYVVEAGGAQPVGYAVGDIALRNAVQRDPHIRS